MSLLKIKKKKSIVLWNPVFGNNVDNIFEVAIF